MNRLSSIYKSLKTKLKMRYLWILVLASCSESGRVEQEIRSMPSYNLCDNPSCFITYIRYDDIIATVWYDNPRTLTDSIVLLRQKQANDLLNTLKKSK